MRRVVVATLVVAGLAVGSGLAQAQSQTEKEVTQTIIDSAKYTNANLKGQEGDYSRYGALEFWSSGGLLQLSHFDSPTPTISKTWGALKALYKP